ncbi:hypothetical protein ACFYXH_40845, partial [Streptomyces sp. NPDC002730]
MPFTVIVYALTNVRGERPVRALERAQAYARYMRWRVVAGSFYDDCGMTDPMERPDLTRALRAVAGGFAQGIVTVDRAAVSAADGEYENALTFLRDHHSFLAHVPPDFAVPSPSAELVLYLPGPTGSADGLEGLGAFDGLAHVIAGC